MADQYKVSKKVLEDNDIEIKISNNVNFSLDKENVIKGKIVEISDEDVKIVKE